MAEENAIVYTLQNGESTRVAKNSCDVTGALARMLLASNIDMRVFEYYEDAGRWFETLVLNEEKHGPYNILTSCTDSNGVRFTYEEVEVRQLPDSLRMIALLGA